MKNNKTVQKKVAIIGGCGHVGLPLGIKLAIQGHNVSLIDINERAVSSVNSGKLPFMDEGGDEQLQSAIANGLRASSDPEACSGADVFIFVTSTPVDEHLNPKLSKVLGIFDSYSKFFKSGALVVIRSTLYPGTMEHLKNRIKESKLKIHLAFCPERVAHGSALKEIGALPQIVAAFDDKSFKLALDLFLPLVPEVIRLAPLEAEMAKLMTNCWRYMEFAVANQFYMIAESSGADFSRILQAIRYNYPRAKNFKSPGFTAGPRLFKDTMQLASYFDHQFYMGHSAMLVNEGLSEFVIGKVTEELGGELWEKTVGLLGMTFKADNDDIRESLSFRVKKGLEFRGANVVCHDPFWADSQKMDLVLEESDALILTTPHSCYRDIDYSKPMIDIWNFFGSTEIEISPGALSAANLTDKTINLKTSNKQ